MLVNITAGFDLRLDEFEAVGNTIRAFASTTLPWLSVPRWIQK